mgnify:CR=1 FL=1
MFWKVLLSTLLFSVVTAQAQQYPDRPVRVIVGFAAGSGPDIQARTIAQQLTASLGQSFFVENRLGANGTIAARVPEGVAGVACYDIIPR